MRHHQLFKGVGVVLITSHTFYLFKHKGATFDHSLRLILIDMT